MTLRRWRRNSHPHICLAARDLAVVEHLGAIARQARQVGIDVCWLELPDQPGTRAAIQRFAEAGASTHEVRDEGELARHLDATSSVAVWIQTPYPEHYPSWFWSAAAGRVAFANYGLTIDAGWDFGNYGLDVYREAAWLVTESDDERDAHISHGVRPDRVFFGGNPLLAELRDMDASGQTRLFDLMWAPHWTEVYFGKRGYSRWRETAPAILGYAKANPDSAVLLRPHPLLPEAIAKLPSTDPAAAAYLELTELPNVTSSTGRLVDDIVASKALITDGVSIIGYWSATGRPLGITRDEESPPFNEAGEALVASADVLATAEDVAEWLSRLPLAQFSEARRALSARIHPTFDRSPIDLWNEHRLRVRQ